jgi:hypothetical protein
MGTVLLFGWAAVLQIHAQTPATPPAHQAPDPARVSALSHKLLDAAVKVNGLAGADLKPWHMKAEFQMLSGASDKPKSGTFEEWYQSRYHWRRTYSGAEGYWNGTEWRTSKTGRSISNPPHNQFNREWMNLRVSRPVIDPLYQVGNIKPDEDLKVERLAANGSALNCTSLAHPSGEEYGNKPEWIVPMMCFDPDLHLRVVHSEETVVQFNDVQPFQGRAVARDIKIIYEGRFSAEIKITQLETVPSIDESVLRPETPFEEQPYEIEPSDPQPRSIYEVGTIIPLVSGTSQPFRGTLMVPVVIRKDGTVKVTGAVGTGRGQGLYDAVVNAVGKWKFEPYLVDGAPVEAAFTVRYHVDGKPFVPSYERKGLSKRAN